MNEYDYGRIEVYFLSKKYESGDKLPEDKKVIQIGNGQEWIAYDLSRVMQGNERYLLIKIDPTSASIKSSDEKFFFGVDIDTISLLSLEEELKKKKAKSKMEF